MELLAYMALGLIGLTVVVFVHEGGHFLAARWMGVEVEAFAVGCGISHMPTAVGWLLQNEG